ncbi:MAG: hypothetical protein IKC71_01870 [Clostridia bacterium]|nr:hypothetical protein [Clostridia bacterium]MBR2870494.1 hypothetical protein [Clostridia bacterium]
MTKVNAKCPYCNEVVLTEEGLRYDECPKCKNIYETEKGLKLYREQLENKQNPAPKKRRFWKTFGSVLLLILECIGYLIYALSFVWLFFDVLEAFKKK